METGDYTLRDLVLYVVLSIAFFEFFMFIPSQWIELLTAQISSNLFNLLGFTSSYGLKNNLAFMDLTGGARYVYVYIIRECTAIHVWGVILGLVVPLKAGSHIRKVKAVLFGAAFIFVMNITRIMLTVYLTGYDVWPLSWFFTNPTVETYHYPISFLYGVIGIAVTITLINHWYLPELGDFLATLPDTLRNLTKNTGS
ncbi:MAG: hypothetical protein NWE89_14885 [Candidatus Bathyarchaeota archaeon]|nr:hypothetical protein [Candidatus Bathyarchaeota archaeon]